MHKISVIIPIYNAELYLSQCLESVIKQNYQNLEIILVDDGCIDSCPKICDEYAEKDNRIKVIHKKNGGLSDARNAGLRIAKGDYFSFVDNDDLLSVYFYERLMQVALENNADIVECGFIKFAEETELENLVFQHQNAVEILETEIALKLLIKDNLQPMVWNKIYRKKVLSNLKFPIGKSHEDVFWTYKVFGNAKKIVRIHDVLYFYRQHQQSIMGKTYSLQRLDGLIALEQRIKYMRENFPDLENLAVKVFCFGSFSHYQKICEHKEIDPKKIFRKKIIKNVIKYNKLHFYKKWDLKAIFWFQLFIWIPNVYVIGRKYNDCRVKYLKQNDTLK